MVAEWVVTAEEYIKEIPDQAITYVFREWIPQRQLWKLCPFLRTMFQPERSIWIDLP